MRQFSNLLKVAFNESLIWEKNLIRITPDNMKVLPASFADKHKQMLSHLPMMISKCISKEYDKIFISLRTVYANELSVDKERTSYSDSLDALSLACKMDKMK